MTFDLNSAPPTLDASQSPMTSTEGVGSFMDGITKAKEKERFIHQIRDQFYYIEIWLYNQIQEPFPVPFLFVHSLSIEENLTDWSVKGWITFNNTLEVFERGSPYDSDGVVKAPYTFRSDGRNRLSLKIYPIPSDRNIYLDSGIIDNDILPRDKWEMSFDCVIYDIEDIPSNNNFYKLKKCYFWDERYQLFSEKNIEWSTAIEGRKTMENIFPTRFPTLPEGTKISELKDIERSIPANIAIRSIIEKASKVDPSNPDPGNTIKIGYRDDTGTIDDPDISLDQFDLFWNEGPEFSECQTNILYTSPANSNINDDIEYVMQNAMSEKKNPVFLRFSRSVVQVEAGQGAGDDQSVLQNKYWSLVSLDDIFKNAERNQIERLYIADAIESSGQPHVPRGPDRYNSDIQNFTSGYASRITSYKFSPMVSIDDLAIHNKPVHCYDFKTGTWIINAAENTAQKTIETFTEMAKTGLYSFETNLDAHLAINLNQSKQKGIIHSNKHVTRTFFPPNLSRLEMMKSLLLLNQTVTFVVNGLTIRTPGQFIFIDRPSSGINNPFDDRFLGQWLILKVVHLFNKDNYVTEVLATKVDIFSKIWETIDDKL